MKEDILFFLCSDDRNTASDSPNVQSYRSTTMRGYGAVSGDFSEERAFKRSSMRIIICWPTRWLGSNTREARK